MSQHFQIFILFNYNRIYLNIQMQNIKMIIALVFMISICHPQSLKGKIMCGYQAWFTTEQDGSNNGWTHYKMNSNKPFAKNNCVFDFWPYIEDYQKTYPIPEFENKYQLQSPRDYSTIATHFQWMKQYGIDGIFLQRFGSDIRNKGSNIYKFKNEVFQNVRKAASSQNKLWVLMYDLSGLQKGQIQSVIIEDWKFLNTQYNFTHDQAYAKHNGKPVVAVWGLGFNDNRKYTLEQCDELVTFLKQGQFGNNTVMLGVPKYWREGGGDAVKGDQLQLLHNIINKTDIVSPWTVGRYSDLNGATIYSKVYVKGDLDWCKQNNLQLMPVIFPGFSWHNLQASGENPDHPGPYNQIPRKQNGQYFLERQGIENVNVGAQMLYVAMFDEINEGTAIYKCSKNPPFLTDGLRFVPYEEDEDFYLKLTGKIGEYLRHKNKISVEE